MKDNYEPGRFFFHPEEIFVHNDWNPFITRYDADIAILSFESGKIHFSEYVQPICLWETPESPVATVGKVVGWGKSEDTSKSHENIPKLIEVPIHSNENCFLVTPGLAELSSRRTFCAGFQNGAGVCFGDSGGGFFIKVSGTNYLKGIVSSSLTQGDLCDVTKYAVYTDILMYSDWIDDIIGDDGNLPPAGEVFGRLENNLLKYCN